MSNRAAVSQRPSFDVVLNSSHTACDRTLYVHRMVFICSSPYATFPCFTIAVNWVAGIARIGPAFHPGG